MTSGTQKMRFTSAYLAIALAFSAQRAHAIYTVIDDDLFPTRVVEAREAPPTRTDQQPVPFAKGSYSLGPLGRKAMEQVAAEGNNATYKILARGDAQPTNVAVGDGSTTVPLATVRANTLKQFLMRQGIPASSITLAPDNSPNPQQNGAIYTSFIVVSRGGTQPLPTDPNVKPAVTANLTPVTISSTVAATPSKTPPAAPAAPVSTSVAVPVTPLVATADRERLVRFITQSVQSGTMDAATALSLMTRLANNETIAPTNPPLPAATTALPAPTLPTPATPAAVPAAAVPEPPPAIPASIIVANPTLVRKSVWVLDKALTLKDNIEAWSKKAAWNPPQWDASNYYEVTRTVPIEADFPDVLRQVADATGLNICANKRQKLVRVTDKHVPCNEK